MYISPISNNNYHYKKNPTKTINAKFKAHPDFYKLARDYEVTASNYFRRGPCYGSPDERYIDIVNTFKKLFSQNKERKPIKILIVGIGNSQEPFSYLATIKEIIGNKKLSEVLDLHIIDLQSKPKEKQLFDNSYYDQWNRPEFASSSFIKDPKEFSTYGIKYSREYRVNDEIFEFLKSTYNDKTKSKWDTRVQDGIKEYENNSFDIISINNTLGYLETRDECIDVISNTDRALKKDGVFITDTYYTGLDLNPQGNFSKLYNGIFKKL